MRRSCSVSPCHPNLHVRLILLPRTICLSYDERAFVRRHTYSVGPAGDEGQRQYPDNTLTLALHRRKDWDGDTALTPDLSP